MIKRILILMFILLPCANNNMFCGNEDFCKTLGHIIKGERVDPLTIRHFNVDQLGILRNAVFARHGYKFRSAQLNKLFYNGKAPCNMQFKQVSNYNPDELEEIDKLNLYHIRLYEENLLIKEYLNFFIKLELPSTVNEFVKFFGDPEHIVLPDPDDPSPHGQYFKWELLSHTVDITILADAYELEPDFEAEVRYVEIEAKNPNVNMRLFYGLTLNKTSVTEVIDSFDNVYNSQLPSFDSKIILDGNNYDEGLYLFLKYNSEEKLTKAAITNIQIEMAD